MKYFALVALFLLSISVSAQEMPKVPEMPFRVVDDFLKIPSDMFSYRFDKVVLQWESRTFS
jgi:hypothetical protein